MPAIRFHVLIHPTLTRQHARTHIALDESNGSPAPFTLCGRFTHRMRLAERGEAVTCTRCVTEFDHEDEESAGQAR
jgi:hypothetical protein